MKSLVRVAIILGGVVGASTVASAFVVGCGGDDTVIPMADGGVDAKPDVGTVETGTEDAGKDSNPGFDAGPLTIGNYVRQINAATCARLAFCCQGSPAPAFDTGGCLALFETNPQLVPGLGNQAALAGYLDGGHITFNLAKANECFADMAALPCASYSATDIQKLRTDCLAGAVGNIPQGSRGCRGSAECVPPSHCDTTVDGGVCAAPLAAGAACGAALANEAQAECGFLLSGVPNYCQTSDKYANTDGGGQSNQCTPPRPIDAGCHSHVECASGLCTDTTDPVLLAASANGCGTSITFATADTCSAFVIPDAGTD